MKNSETTTVTASGQNIAGDQRPSTVASFTPGPWHVTYFNGVADQILGPNREDIASLYATDGADELTKYPVNQNAALIAAAPEMLEALKEQHGAIDLLLAMLIERDPKFLPTKSAAWAAVEQGHRVIAKATCAP